MQTNVVIDNALIQKALKLSGLNTEKSVVEATLKLFIQLHQQTALRELRGKVSWKGDLDKMRFD